MHHSTLARHRSHRNFRHVTEQYGDSVLGKHHDIGEVVLRRRSPQTENGILLLGVLDEARPEVFIVLAHAGEDVMQREVVAAQRRRIDFDDVLLGFASPRVDLAHALHRAQVETQAPVEQRLEIHQRLSRALQRKLKRFAENAGQRSHDRLEPSRNPSLRLADPLVDELTGKKNIDVIVEHDGDHREAELGNRSDRLHVWDTHQRGLERERHELFDLGGRHAGSLDRDVDLSVGEIGEGLDWNVPHRVQAEGDYSRSYREHNPAVVEREIDDSSQHRSYSCVSERVRNWDFATKAPSVTTSSPSFSPSTISTSWSTLAPDLTGLASNSELGPRTKTTGLPLRFCTESSGTNKALRDAPRAISAVAYIS